MSSCSSKSDILCANLHGSDIARHLLHYCVFHQPGDGAPRRQPGIKVSAGRQRLQRQLPLGVGTYLLVFQFVGIHVGTQFGLIGGEFRRGLIPVALLGSLIVPVTIFFLSKQKIEAKRRNASGERTNQS